MTHVGMQERKDRQRAVLHSWWVLLLGAFGLLGGCTAPVSTGVVPPGTASVRIGLTEAIPEEGRVRCGILMPEDTTSVALAVAMNADDDILAMRLLDPLPSFGNPADCDFTAEHTARALLSLTLGEIQVDPTRRSALRTTIDQLDVGPLAAQLSSYPTLVAALSVKDVLEFYAQFEKHLLETIGDVCGLLRPTAQGSDTTAYDIIYDPKGHGRLNIADIKVVDSQAQVLFTDNGTTNVLKGALLNNTPVLPFIYRDDTPFLTDLASSVIGWRKQALRGSVPLKSPWLTISIVSPGNPVESIENAFTRSQNELGLQADATMMTSVYLFMQVGEVLLGKWLTEEVKLSSTCRTEFVKYAIDVGQEFRAIIKARPDSFDGATEYLKFLTTSIWNPFLGTDDKRPGVGFVEACAGISPSDPAWTRLTKTLSKLKGVIDAVAELKDSGLGACDALTGHPILQYQVNLCSGCPSKSCRVSDGFFSCDNHAPQPPCYKAADRTYCAIELPDYQGSPNDLVTCKGGLVSGTAPCPSGCKLNAAPLDDECKGTAPQPCTGKADGKYCGYSLSGYSGSPSDLVTCSRGGVSSSMACGFGCQMNPPGINDECKPGPCTTYYVDQDGDGHGDTHLAGKCLTSPSAPYTATVADDCNDADADVYSGHVEWWDVKDNNCNGQMDEDGLVHLDRWWKQWSSTNWEHRFSAANPGSGFVKESHWVNVYPTNICGSANSPPSCSVSGGGIFATLRPGINLVALAECGGQFMRGSPGNFVTLYLPENISEYTDYTVEPGFTCRRVGYVLYDSAIGAFASPAPFYRLRSCFCIPGHGDNMWSTQSPEPGYSDYAVKTSGEPPHWYAPAGY